jgi:hypothetical protein
MVTLIETLRSTHDWAIDRIHTLAEENIDDAYAIQKEFEEWFDPNIDEHDIVSLQFIGD